MMLSTISRDPSIPTPLGATLEHTVRKHASNPLEFNPRERLTITSKGKVFQQSPAYPQMVYPIKAEGDDKSSSIIRISTTATEHFQPRFSSAMPQDGSEEYINPYRAVVLDAEKLSFLRKKT